MEKILAIIASFLLTAGMVSAQSGTGGNDGAGKAGNGGTITLRVMSMNIRMGGEYAGYEAGAFSELIKEYDPDIVCCQEVDYKTARNGGRDWLNSVAMETGMFPFYASRPYSTGNFGVAILSKYPFFKAEKIMSDIEGAGELRPTGWVYISLPDGNTVRVASTHLALESSEITIRHIADLNTKIFAEDEETPTLLIGDFNADEGSDPIVYATRKRWQDIGSGTGDTIPSDRPTRRLDYVMGNPRGSWSSTSYEVIARPDLSDHCFIVADVVFTAE